MTDISFQLFGSFRVTIGGRPADHFRVRKARALLAYLAAESHGIHTRQSLQTLFWTEKSATQAANGLRTTLSHLRRALDEVEPGISDALLTVTRESVRLHGAAARSDLWLAQACLDEVQAHAHSELSGCQPCLEGLARTADLIAAPFLADMDLSDALGFEEWLTVQREVQNRLRARVLTQLSEAYEARNELTAALQWAEQNLTLEPFHEEAHRRVMRLWARQGMPGRARAQFEAMRRLLLSELGIEPSAESVALLAQLEAGPGPSAEASAPPLGPSSPISGDRSLPDSPAPMGPPLPGAPMVGAFYGRSFETRRLEEWVGRGTCQVVTILGMAGMGKTTLAAHTVQILMDRFDQVIWHSLINAPILGELLATLGQKLWSRGQPVGSPEDELARLLDYCRTRRVLLVLDNFESVLDGARPGRYLAGYEPYEQLVTMLADHRHPSCLLLTSRERPRSLARREDDSHRVHSIELNGLEEEAGRALLAHQGISGSDLHKNELIHRYSGNPLALKLVADTVADLYFGNVQEFLQDDTIVFDDIRVLLDQQFARLSQLEQDLLYCLAINRVTASVAALRRDLLNPPAGREVIEALRGLQSRSLLEREAEGFGLQNVVIEYLTDRLVAAGVREVASGHLDLLRRLALLKAQAEDHLRHTQSRLILGPLGRQLAARFTPDALKTHLRALLQGLRGAGTPPGFAPGNLINLLIHLQMDLAGWDFSSLPIRQADLRGQNLAATDFRNAHFDQTSFTADFGRIYALAVSPDSRLVAAGTGEGEIRLWQIPSLEAAGSYRAHTGQVTAVAYSPDGTLLASCGRDAAVVLRHPTSGEVVCRPAGHQGVLNGIAFHPEGDLLAGGGDGTVYLWEIPSGRLLWRFQGHRDRVDCLAFHPRGALLATGSADGTVGIWHLPRARFAREDGSRVEGTDPPRLRHRLQGSQDKVAALAFSPDGTLLASGCAGTRIHLWQTHDGACLRVLEGHTHWVRGLAFSKDGRLLASGSADRTVRLWEMPTGSAGAVLEGHGQVVWSVAFTLDGKHLVSAGQDSSVRLWNARPSRLGQAVRVLRGYSRAILSVAFDRQGELLAAADERHTVAVWAETGGRQARPPKLLTDHGAKVNRLAFHPAADELASGDDQGVVYIWDMAGNRLSTSFQAHRHAVHDLKYDVTGTYLASAGWGGDIRLWQRSGTDHYVPGPALDGHRETVHALAFSPRERLLASAGRDRKIRLWDLQTGQCRQILEGHPLEVWALAFNPAGTLLASAGRDGHIFVWAVDEAGPGHLRNVFAGHYGIVRHLAFSPEGDRLASAGADGRTCLWDIPGQALARQWQAHHQPVSSVAFHPRAEILASGSFDGTVKLWNSRTGEALETLRPPGPYQGMQIAGAGGLSPAQHAILKALGAVGHPT